MVEPKQPQGLVILLRQDEIRAGLFAYHSDEPGRAAKQKLYVQLRLCVRLELHGLHLYQSSPELSDWT
jgi:hypothetical protein